MIRIPTFQTTSARYTMHMVLDGSIYNLDFNWNTRESAWYMDISDSNKNPILMGVKLVPNYRLLKQYIASYGLPPGEFLLVDQLNDDQTGVVAFDNFGDRYVLVYMEAADLAAARVS